MPITLSESNALSALNNLVTKGASYVYKQGVPYPQNAATGELPVSGWTPKSAGVASAPAAAPQEAPSVMQRLTSAIQRGAQAGKTKAGSLIENGLSKFSGLVPSAGTAAGTLARAVPVAGAVGLMGKTIYDSKDSPQLREEGDLGSWAMHNGFIPDGNGGFTDKDGNSYSLDDMATFQQVKAQGAAENAQAAQAAAQTEQDIQNLANSKTIVGDTNTDPDIAGLTENPWLKGTPHTTDIPAPAPKARKGSGRTRTVRTSVPQPSVDPALKVADVPNVPNGNEQVHVPEDKPALSANPLSGLNDLLPYLLMGYLGYKALK